MITHRVKATAILALSALVSLGGPSALAQEGDRSSSRYMGGLAELSFWINGEEAATGTVRRTVPAVFTASETFDVGMDTSSPVANAYIDKAPFAFEGTLKKLHFEYLPAGDPGFIPTPDDD